MNIAVAILNWNGSALLREYLPSVVEHSGRHRVIVVDNASDDDSVQVLAAEFPSVEVLRLDRNYGFAGGYNLALSQINSEIVVLLNSDVRVSPSWLEPISKAFNDFPRMVACQPKILDDNNPEHFEYAGACGGFVDRLGYPYCRGRIFDHIEMDHGQYEDVIEIDWATGAALCVRRANYIEAGGLDEDFFAHHEEIDLCLRFKRLGKIIKVIPQSVVYHKGGGTLSEENPRKTYLNFRNSLFNLVKNSGDPLVPVLFVRMVLDGLAAIRFLGMGELAKFGKVFKAHISFYRMLPSMLYKRRHFSHYQNPKQEFNLRANSVVYQYMVKNRKRFTDLKLR